MAIRKHLHRLEDMLVAVPEDQRASLRRQFKAADKAGWTRLGLFSWDYPDESDLFGVPPGKRFGQFVGDLPGETDRGKIPQETRRH